MSDAEAYVTMQRTTDNFLCRPLRIHPDAWKEKNVEVCGIPCKRVKVFSVISLIWQQGCTMYLVRILSSSNWLRNNRLIKLCMPWEWRLLRFGRERGKTRQRQREDALVKVIIEQSLERKDKSTGQRNSICLVSFLGCTSHLKSRMVRCWTDSRRARKHGRTSSRESIVSLTYTQVRGIETGVLLRLKANFFDRGTAIPEVHISLTLAIQQFSNQEVLVAFLRRFLLWEHLQIHQLPSRTSLTSVCFWHL